MDDLGGECWHCEGGGGDVSCRCLPNRGGENTNYRTQEWRYRQAAGGHEQSWQNQRGPTVGGHVESQTQAGRQQKTINCRDKSFIHGYVYGRKTLPWIFLAPRNLTRTVAKQYPSIPTAAIIILLVNMSVLMFLFYTMANKSKIRIRIKLY